MPEALTSHGWGFVALRGGSMGTGLIDLDAIAFLSKIPRATLRTWHRRGKLNPEACDVRTRRYLFNLEDLDVMAKKRKPRQEREAA